jgi:hypothetical protein
MPQSKFRAAAFAFLSVLSLRASGALADEPACLAHPTIHVDGSYHSVTNGIADYDGFDRFRDAKGQPLPGWEPMLRSPG